MSSSRSRPISASCAAPRAEELFAAAALLGYPGARHHRPQHSLGRHGQGARGGQDDRGAARRRLPARPDGRHRRSWSSPTTAPPWSRLSRLLTLGKQPRRQGREGELSWEDGRAWRGPGRGAGARRGRRRAAPALAQLAPTSATAPISRSPSAAGRARPCGCMRWTRSPGRSGVPTVATGDVLYDAPDRRMLQDVVTAIREPAPSTSWASAASASPTAISRRRRRWRGSSGAFPTRSRRRRHRRALHLLAWTSCAYQYPDEIVMPGLHAAGGAGAADPGGRSPALSRTACRTRSSASAGARAAADRRAGLRALFPHRPFDRPLRPRQEILCQGRGSAANSVICYVLGITSIDPVEHDLLFERFVSDERATSRPTSTSISSTSGARR